MKQMGKLRVAGNRLSLGSWSMPFSRSPSGGQNKRYSTPATVHTEGPLYTPHTPPAATQPSTSQLISLAAIITRETEKLDRYLKESGAPSPSFDADGPANFPKLEGEIKRAREEVVRATKELGDLVTGPTEKLRWMAWDVRIFPLLP
jgi:hypothetical protein